MFFVFVIFLTAIFLFSFKVIIRTVIIKNLIISFSEKVGIFVNFYLDKIRFSTKNIQCTVDIMEFVGRFF